MAGYRKLGRTSSQRKALLRNQVTNLLYHGKIQTTETRAKEIRRIAESMIALAVKERDNYETVTVTAPDDLVNLIAVFVLDLHAGHFLEHGLCSVLARLHGTSHLNAETPVKLLQIRSVFIDQICIFFA
mgnify:CR=1 FL=1